MSWFKNIFHKKVPPDELVKEWRRNVRHEMHGIDREVRQLERSEAKIKMEIKKLAKAGEIDTAKMLAKELVQSKKAKERMYEAKARMNSVILQLNEQLATIKMTQAISSSTEAMGAMNELVNMPVVGATMRQMGREMEKAGFIQEMMDDTLDAGEDISDEADEEVNRVFDEITADILGDAISAPHGKVGSQEKISQKGSAQAVRN